MKIIIIFGLLATALSETVYQMGFTSDANIANFKMVDLNGDGIIHLSELFTRFRTADKNDDGNVTIEEFTTYQNPPDLPPLQLQIFFNFMETMDSAVDGVIDSSFICTYFSLLDVDNNRKATLGEYKNFSTQVHNYLKKELKDIAGC